MFEVVEDNLAEYSDSQRWELILVGPVRRFNISALPFAILYLC